MRIDAHLHIWRAMPDQPHPPGTAMSPTSDVPLALYAEYMAEHAIDRAVFVQTMYPGEDNSYVADCAVAQPDRLAAVCVVDPRQPGAADRLEYWVQARGCRGLRLRPRFGPEAAVFGHPSTHGFRIKLFKRKTKQPHPNPLSRVGILFLQDLTKGKRS